MSTIQIFFLPRWGGDNAQYDTTADGTEVNVFSGKQNCRNKCRRICK